MLKKQRHNVQDKFKQQVVNANMKNTTTLSDYEMDLISNAMMSKELGIPNINHKVLRGAMPPPDNYDTQSNLSVAL